MSTQNPIGLHIEGLGMGDAEISVLLTHVAKADYKTVTVMDNFGLAQEIKDLLPDCVVVFRDSKFEPAPGYTVKQFTDYLGGLTQDKRIVIMVNCEQDWSADRVALWCSMILVAEALGWKLCVGNTSAGSIKCGQGSDPNDWLTIGAPLLKCLLDHPGHYLGVHNYSGPFLWLVSNGGWGDPQKPPDKIDWTKPQWHLGREAQGIMAACKQLGYQKLLEREFLIITEGFIDQMADTEQNPGNPYRAIKSNRWRMLQDFWAKEYLTIDPQHTLANQHCWAWEKIYAPLGFVVGVHIFLYRDASNHDWLDDRVDNAPIYLKRMEDYHPAATASVAAPATNTPVAATVTAPIVTIPPESSLAVTTGTQQPASSPAQPVTTSNSSEKANDSTLDNSAIRAKLQAIKLALGTLTDEVDTLLNSLPA